MARTVQFIVVATLVFFIWVAFALLIVNPYLHPYVPGYKVGNPCGWEFVAATVSLAITYFWTKGWPDPVLEDCRGKKVWQISSALLRFLLFYFVAAIAIFLWQYSLFSASFQ